MRLTLEELKAMSNEELHEHWAEAAFPFENMADCGNCLTSHNPGYIRSCQEHEQVRETMRRFPFEGGLNLQPYLEELYAIRLFYDHLYPPAEAPAAPLEHRATDAIAASATNSLGVQP